MITFTITCLFLSSGQPFIALPLFIISLPSVFSCVSSPFTSSQLLFFLFPSPPPSCCLPFPILHLFSFSCFILFFLSFSHCYKSSFTYLVSPSYALPLFPYLPFHHHLFVITIVTIIINCLFSNFLVGGNCICLEMSATLLISKPHGSLRGCLGLRSWFFGF